MIILEAAELACSVQDRLLFTAERLKVGDRDRIGIVGLNGAGKTTLLNVLAGLTEPERGWVKAGVPPVLVPQLKPHPSSLSGGEITHRYLSEALDREPALLLADEPTMHLDAAHIARLEERLAAFEGALLVVSHDRAFLDRLCTSIWALADGKVAVYKGNYSDYAAMRELEKRQREEKYEAYVEKRRQLEEAIAVKKGQAAGMLKVPKRIGAKEARLYAEQKRGAQKGVHQAIRAIETRIEKLERVEKPREQPRIKLDVPGGREFTSKTALRVEKLTAGFGARTLWRDVSFRIPRGSKTVLIGPNGAGKTTLVRRILAGGDGIHLAPGAKLGYFSQNLDILDPRRSVLENVSRTAVQSDANVRLVLARLLFRRDDIYKPVGVLSGGERVKAAFAKLLLGDVNLLILDEPTNFLDIPSIEALEELLAGYEGTVLFVSHDRRFAERTADRVLEIRDGAVVPFDGGYAECQAHAEEKTVPRERQALEEERMTVETRFSEVLGKLSFPGLRPEEAEALDREFRALAARRRELNLALGGA